jgi:hypothetical protein
MGLAINAAGAVTSCPPVPGLTAFSFFEQKSLSLPLRDEALVTVKFSPPVPALQIPSKPKKTCAIMGASFAGFCQS